ncbi:MAG: hypothetical protein WCJ62_11615, partial [Flavobacterium sp.]
DEKGNQYIFNIFNNSNAINNAYYLSSILDNNNKELVHYTYQTCYTPAVIGVSGAKTFNKLKEINAMGFGKVTLNYADITVNCFTAKLAEMVLSDAKDNPLKKMKLVFTQFKISQIQISDISETKKEIYKFDYDEFDTSLGNAFDTFGYKTLPPCGSLNNTTGVPSPTKCKVGALIKMKLPTGGCIVYDYESNTYSKYYKGSDTIWHLDLNPNSYYDNLNGNTGLVGVNIPLIQENYIPTYYDNGSFPFTFTNASSTYNFTVTGTSYKTLYFTTIGQEYTTTPPHPTPDNPNPESTIYFPTFTLTRTSGIPYVYPHFGENGFYKDDTSGLCLGQKIDLSPGNYSVTINSINNQYNNGTLEIRTMELNSTPRKWYYGGGVRIKRIGFFDTDAPLNYYYSTYTATYNSQGYHPVIEKKYSYDFFGTTNSSGYLVNSDFNIINQGNDLSQYAKTYFGGYKNVTVGDSQNNGREEYTFKDGLDPIDLDGENSGIIFENTKRGLLLNKKTYDTTGILLNSIDFTYDFNCPESDGGLSTTYSYSSQNNSYPSFFTPNPSTPTITSNLLEIGKLTQKTTTDYYSNGQSKTITEYFSYDVTTLQLIEHRSKNSLGEILKTEYYYDTNNSPYSQNRISEPLQTKTYRGGTLLSTNKINYSFNLVGNSSYLPQTIAFAKGTGGLEVRKRFNQYDNFSNLLEEQNEYGRITSYIYGYNNTVIVAKLDNISYGDIPYSLIAAIQLATDSPTATETDVTTAQNALRTSTNVNLQKAMISTYTYRPLIGISTAIDVKGNKTSYEYDELGRLIRVRDKDSYILSETQYNLLNQN